MIKRDLAKYIGSDELVGQNGDGRIYKIPIKTISMPRFTFNDKNGGGTGMGKGELGDPMGGQGDEDGKPGKPGNAEGDHSNFAEFTVDELAQILGEELALPDIDEKGKGKVVSSKNRYNGISRVGNDGLRHFRKSYKEALKRSISSGTYDPVNPVVIPERRDFRYKIGTPHQEESCFTSVIYMMDVSGSMGDEQKQIVKSTTFWIDAWLSTQYKGIETRYIIHDTVAKEVSREDFFSTRESGGTSISSAYKLCDEIMKRDYPFSEWNVYPFHFSDGDNYNGEDDQLCMSLLTDHIMPNCNVFSYGQVTSQGGSGEFFNALEKAFPNGEKLQLAKMDNHDGIIPCIKSFLGKGK